MRGHAGRVCAALLTLFDLVLTRGGLALWIVLLLLPLIPLFLWSLTAYWPWPSLWPFRWSTDAWQYLLSPGGRAWEGLYNSLAVAGLTWLFNLLLGIPAARVLAQRVFPGRGPVFALVLMPLFVPSTVAVMGLYTLFIPLSGTSPYLGVSLSHVLPTLPYFVAALWYQFRLLGTDLGEAARNLGANPWQVFWWVEFPQILPGLLLASLLVFLISLSQYVPTWIMSGGTLLTLPLLIYPFAESGNASVVAAYSVWFFWPILLLLGAYSLLRWRWGRVGGGTLYYGKRDVRTFVP